METKRRLWEMKKKVPDCELANIEEKKKRAKRETLEGAHKLQKEEFDVVQRLRARIYKRMCQNMSGGIFRLVQKLSV